jgi:hypothetical protein
MALTAAEKLCNEKHRGIDEDLKRHDEAITDHGKKIGVLEYDNRNGRNREFQVNTR